MINVVYSTKTRSNVTQPLLHGDTDVIVVLSSEWVDSAPASHN